MKKLAIGVCADWGTKTSAKILLSRTFLTSSVLARSKCRNCSGTISIKRLGDAKFISEKCGRRLDILKSPNIDATVLTYSISIHRRGLLFRPCDVRSFANNATWLFANNALCRRDVRSRHDIISPIPKISVCCYIRLKCTLNVVLFSVHNAQ